MNKHIIIAIVSLFVSLVLVEFFLSRFLPQKTYSAAYKNAIACFEESDMTVFTLKPKCTFSFTDFDTEEFFSTRTNALGYRDKDFDIKKKAGEKRILFLGDSFILGFGVKDDGVVTSILEDKLKKSGTVNFLSGARVINAGYAGGFGPDGYYLHLKNEGMKLTPDLVVFSIFVFNDFSDMEDNEWIGVGKYGEPEKVVSKTTIVDKDGHLMPITLPLVYRIPIIRESHLAVFAQSAFKAVWAKLIHYYDRVRFKIKPPVMPTGDAKDSSLPGVYESSCIFRETCHRRTLHLYTDLFSTILASKNLLQSESYDDKPRFVVLLIPVEFQIYPDTLYKYKSDDGIPTNSAAIENPNPQRRIKEMLDWEKIPYIDLLPVFRKSKDRLYFVKDGHWNRKGHEVVAEEIVKWIKENNKN